MALDNEMIEILLCPQCKGGLIATEKKDGLICEACRLVYPIVKDDIPILLVHEAAPYTPSSSNE
ncbi:MAG: Trm112 family protein [Candidatus Nitronauta litoralis]|uniref:Trm112 family protein n=1 Tax=Candidatus Nitronauta litoralis TaxID=2705533 RepID=A0A7T0BXG7_9BACT|nr:MAG: Trm112 family protein [Candidatus Nitronauta litoralis]